MSTVLMTWNPGPYDDHAWTPELWDDQIVEPLLNGETVLSTWSVGKHVNINQGDTACMYRQGEFGRGIVASGVVRTSLVSDTHFKGKGKGEGKTTNYVDVEWLGAVPTNLAITVEALELRIPEFKWLNVYSSGRPLPEEVGKSLLTMWDAYVLRDDVVAASKLWTSTVWRDFVDSAGYLLPS